MMEIKTTHELFIELHQGTMDKTRAYKRWVAVDDVLNWVDRLRKSNDMWRYPVDECFGMLENVLECEEVG